MEHVNRHEPNASSRHSEWLHIWLGDVFVPDEGEPSVPHHCKLGVTGVTPRDFGATKGLWLHLAVPEPA
jgi:hypothetical protein